MAEWQAGKPRRTGRPRGEIRQAVADAARKLATERTAAPLQGLDGSPLVGATWPELMQRSCTSWTASARVIKDMVRGRELAKLGRVRVEGFGRPLTVYAPAAGLAPDWARGHDSVREAFEAMCRQHG